MKLEPAFWNKVAELIYVNSEFERLLLRVCGFNTIFQVITAHGRDLLYYTSSTGCW